MENPNKFSCKLCNFTTERKLSLGVHVKSKHKPTPHWPPASLFMLNNLSNVSPLAKRDVQEKEACLRIRDGENEDICGTASEPEVSATPSCILKDVKEDDTIQVETPAQEPDMQFDDDDSNLVSSEDDDKHSLFPTVPTEAPPGVLVRRSKRKRGENDPDYREWPLKARKYVSSPSVRPNRTKPVRVQRGDKRFQCSECEYACTQSSTLKEHLLRCHEIYDNEPFRCQQCYFATHYKCYFRIHLNTCNAKAGTSHAEKSHTFTCDYCDLTSSSKGHLKRHTKISHPSVEA